MAGFPHRRTDALGLRKTSLSRNQGGVAGPLTIDPARLVFIDETWTKSNMAPLRGWNARGKRLIGKAPHGHWRTQTFLAALRCDRIEAPCVFDGPINGLRFLTYVRAFLVPSLKPGDVVVMDNLGPPQRKSRSPSHPQRRCQAFVPPALLTRSPPPRGTSLNPIEQVFAKLKHWLRRSAERTVDAVCTCIGKLLEHIPASE